MCACGLMLAIVGSLLVLYVGLGMRVALPGGTTAGEAEAAAVSVTAFGSCAPRCRSLLGRGSEDEWSGVVRVGMMLDQESARTDGKSDGRLVSVAGRSVSRA